MAVYSDAKTLAERAMWAWADQHPDVEITTSAFIDITSLLRQVTDTALAVHPPWVFGPLSRFWMRPDAPDYLPLTSNIMIATMMKPEGPYPPDPPYVDVRDVAKGLVSGLKAWKPAPEGDRNRVVMIAPQFFDCGKARAELLRRHPELEARVVAKEPPPFLGPAPVEYEWVERVLNLKKEDFHSFEQVRTFRLWALDSPPDDFDRLLMIPSIAYSLWKRNGGRRATTRKHQTPVLIWSNSLRSVSIV